MKKIILYLILFSYTHVIKAQSANKWTNLLSYSKTVDIDFWEDEIIVGCEYGIFLYDIQYNSLRKFSKIDGLLNEKITSIKALNNFDAFVIGFQTGEFDVFYKSGDILHVSDIKTSTILGDKKINAIAQHGDKIFLATPFGIVEYNLIKENFGDTYYFGEGGKPIYVNDIAVSGNIIFAATTQGVFMTDVENPILIDYRQWKIQNSIPTNNYNSIATIKGKIIVNNSNAKTHQYIFENSKWKSLKDNYANVKKIKSDDNFITYTADKIYIFDDKFQLINTIIPELNSELSVLSAIRHNSYTWIGSENMGLIRYKNSNFTEILPKGPRYNNPFRIKAGDRKLYLMYGAYDDSYKPKNKNIGYQTYDYKKWKYISNEKFSNATDLINITIDKKNNQHIYVSSWKDGLIEILDSNTKNIWNDKNSKLQKSTTNTINVGKSTFDTNGNLWITNSGNVEYPLILKKTNGDWLSFPIKNNTFDAILDICIDANNNKWIATNNKGIWIYNEGKSLETTTDDKIAHLSNVKNIGNLPSNKVNTMAVDKENSIWIGTELGLAVFYNTDNIFDTSVLNAEAIVVKEASGEAKRLLGSQTINKIVVDGGNNKWIATESSGAYLISSENNKTIHHFTKDNSPIYSDNILDLDIDPETGEVFFVTSKGLISYKGNATEGKDKFHDVFAYPNPVTPGYTGDIYIKGLTDRTVVKITDINGNVVFETISNGGQAIWNGYGFGGYKASSGVYLVFAISKNREETAVAKILIVN